MTDDEFDAKASEVLDRWYEDGGDFNANWHGSLAQVISAAMRDAVKAAQEWQPIETAPKDGKIFDVWLGDASEEDVRFYCCGGTRRSAGWHWWKGKFRPAAGLSVLVTFVEPTHWKPLPAAPIAQVVHPPHNT